MSVHHKNHHSQQWLQYCWNKGEQSNHEYLYWEFPSVGGKQAIRRGKWKLVKNNCFREDGGEEELFDLEHDPGEMKDLSKEYPELVKELSGQIESVRTESEIFPFYENNEKNQ